MLRERPPLLPTSGDVKESIHGGIEHLFTVEEVLQRLYHAQGSGCLLIYDADQVHQVFIQKGRIVRVTGPGLQRGAGLDFLGTLTQPRYQWIQNLLTPRPEVDLCIQTSLLQQSHSRDLVLAGDFVRQTSRITNVKADHLSPPPPARLPKYRLEAKDGSGFKLELTKAVTILGREAPPSDLAIPQSVVSRRHCLIKITAHHLMVEDLGSSNGTTVNGISAAKEIPVKVKEEIQLGNYALILQLQVANDKPPVA